MLGRLRSKLTYANVASSLALFLAVATGGAYAANTIGSSDIIDESIKSADIKNGEVKLDDLGGNSVSSGKVVNESISTNDLKDGEVKLADLGGSSVNSAKIVNDSIESGDIKDGEVKAADLAPNVLSGGALPNNAVTSEKIKDGEVKTGDLADGAVTSPKIEDGQVATDDLADGAVTGAKVLDDTVPGGGLTQADLQTNAVGAAEIATDAVGATEIANDSIDAGEIVDFGLSNQDVGVLFAEVQANGTLDNSSGFGVTAARLAAGNYEVDFARNISACTAVATIGPSGGGSALGEVNVADRGGNPEAVFVDTNTSAGAAADLPFRLVVVC